MKNYEKKILPLILSLLLAPAPARAGALQGYERIACNLDAVDASFKSCFCPSGKVALGGSCWLYNFVGKVWAESVTGNAYSCASDKAGAKMYVVVACANP